MSKAIKRIRKFIPPSWAWVRAGIRASFGGIFYASGQTAIGHILLVMSVISLVATVELLLAKDVAGWTGAFVTRFPKRNHPREFGPAYPLAEAVEALSDQQISRRISMLTKRKKDGDPVAHAELQKVLVRRRNLLKKRLIDGHLVAFGIPDEEEDTVEIPAYIFVKGSIRPSEDRIIDPADIHNFTNVTVREDLNSA